MNCYGKNFSCKTSTTFVDRILYEKKMIHTRLSVCISKSRESRLSPASSDVVAVVVAPPAPLSVTVAAAATAAASFCPLAREPDWFSASDIRKTRPPPLSPPLSSFPPGLRSCDCRKIVGICVRLYAISYVKYLEEKGEWREGSPRDSRKADKRREERMESNAPTHPSVMTIMPRSLQLSSSLERAGSAVDLLL